MIGSEMNSDDESSAYAVIESSDLDDFSDSSVEAPSHNEIQEMEEPAMVEDVVMDSELWKDLPHQLHEHILQYIPIPELCRLRTLCRAWNDLTYNRHFAAKSRPPNTYIFKAPDAVGIGLDGRGRGSVGNSDRAITALLHKSWELFDPGTQLFYWVSFEFLYHGVRDRFSFLDRCRIMAADKGFVCVLWSSESVEAMQVANPMTKSVIEIPPFHVDTEYMYAAGAMTVAEDYSAFTVYVVFVMDDPKTECLVRFDSFLGEWRECSRPPGALTPTFVLKVKEMLYTLFWDEVVQRLFAFDTVRGTWTDTGVALPGNVRVPQLATAQGRLFFLGFRDYSVLIKEINVATAQCTMVALLDQIDTGNDEVDLLDSLDSTTVYQPYVGTGSNTAVLGCRDLILFTSITGGSIAFDVVHRVWSEWRFDRRIGEQDDISDSRCGLFGMAMSLSLNPVPAPVHQVLQQQQGH